MIETELSAVTNQPVTNQVAGLFKSFLKCSMANNQCNEINDDMNETLEIIFWNNKFICIETKPTFSKSLAEKGILSIGDLIFY